MHVLHKCKGVELLLNSSLLFEIGPDVRVKLIYIAQKSTFLYTRPRIDVYVTDKCYAKRNNNLFGTVVAGTKNIQFFARKLSKAFIQFVQVRIQECKLRLFC